MKFNKSTTILLNIMLILIIAFLVRSLFAVPKDAHASDNLEYKVIDLKPLSEVLTQEAVAELLNKQVKDGGWKFHSQTSYGLVFER